MEKSWLGFKISEWWEFNCEVLQKDTSLYVWQKSGNMTRDGRTIIGRYSDSGAGVFSYPPESDDNRYILIIPAPDGANTPMEDLGEEYEEIIVGDEGGRSYNAQPVTTPSATKPEEKPETRPEQPETQPTTPALPFADVAPGSWYYKAVAFGKETGYLTGDGAFDPNGPLSPTRLAEMLWRLAGKPATESAGEEVELTETALALRWALAEGILTAEQVQADAPLTREEMVLALYRRVQQTGGGMTGAWYFLLTFADAEQVGEGADEAIHWAVMSGILSGVGENRLAPKAAATPAQAASMLMRFMQLEK